MNKLDDQLRKKGSLLLNDEEEAIANGYFKEDDGKGWNTEDVEHTNTIVTSAIQENLLKFQKISFVYIGSVSNGFSYIKEILDNYINSYDKVNTCIVSSYNEDSKLMENKVTLDIELKENIERILTFGIKNNAEDLAGMIETMNYKVAKYEANENYAKEKPYHSLEDIFKKSEYENSIKLNKCNKRNNRFKLLRNHRRV